MVILGRIGAPFGVKGWLKVQPFGDDALAWREMPQWWLNPEDEAADERWTPHALHDCRAHGHGLIASLDGIADRDAAEKVRGWFVAAPRERLPETARNEYYWADLTGLTVENEAGETLGVVSGLMSTGAHDVLRVRDETRDEKDGGGERLIPFVAAYIINVDVAARRVRVAWQKDW
jgi:16S rRNA processing protein RimM